MTSKDELIRGGHAISFADTKVYPEMPNPSQAELFDPIFHRIWQVIKDWDINVPTHYSGYMGANGSHAKMLLDAVKPPAEDYHERVLRVVEELVGHNPDPGTKNGDLLNVLADALILYENKYFPITEREIANSKHPLVRRGIPGGLVPVYQCRIIGPEASWSDVTPEKIEIYKTKPDYFAKLEFRTLYRGWE